MMITLLQGSRNVQLNTFSTYYKKIVTDDTFDTFETDLSHCSSHRTPVGFVVGKQLIVFSNGKQSQRSFVSWMFVQREVSVM
jgi:hypothetical protein